MSEPKPPTPEPAPISEGMQEIRGGELSIAGALVVDSSNVVAGLTEVGALVRVTFVGTCPCGCERKVATSVLLGDLDGVESIGRRLTGVAARLREHLRGQN